MPLVDDSLRDSFFNSGFEEEATVLESGRVIEGHFYDKYEVAKMFDQDVEASSPMFEIRTSDLDDDIVQKKSLSIRGETFYVEEIQKDGEGFTKLTLTYD